MNSAIRTKLSVMMFLQFFIWGAWYVTAPNYLGTIAFKAEDFGWTYSVGPIAGMITPFFVGMIADRFFPAQRVLGVMHLLGAAIMFGAMIKNEDWLIQVRGLSPDEAAQVVAAAAQALRAEKLIFCRWTQVMVRFEQGLYANPDQDLSKLWWDLKRKYQLLNPPDDESLPGYAAKVHILTTPVYYQSYMLGDLFAAQLHAYVARQVLGIADPAKTSFYAQSKAGEFLRKQVFGPGNLYSWNELTRRATGEDLTAKYFVERFVK